MVGNKFQDIILKHSRSQPLSGRPERFIAEQVLENRLCGDVIHLFLSESVSTPRVHYQATGCAVCAASAAILAASTSEQSVKAIKVIVEDFIKAWNQDQGAYRPTDDIEALFDMKRFPAREKCVLLPWQAMQQCLEKIKGAPDVAD